MKFNTGDKVIVSTDSLEYASIKRGQVGTIIKLNHNLDAYEIDFDEKGFWYLTGNVIDLYKARVNKLQVKFKKLSDNAVTPKFAKPGDAGADLVATSKEFDGDNIVFGTSLALEIPEGHVGLIFPRSSICKTMLTLSNSVGVIDAGYRGEIKAVFRTGERPTKNYEVGDRICQLIVLPYPEVEFEEVEELSSTERGQGGFGSSGK